MATYTALHNGQWVGLYQEDNIRIICKMAIEKSEIFNREMDVITDIVVSVDKLNVYQASYIYMPYNYEGLISIVNYVEKVVSYIRYTEDGMYARKRFLDKFFIDKSTVQLDIHYRNKTREIEEEKRQLKQQLINKEIKDLKKDIQETYNNKGYAVAYGYADIFIIDKKHCNDEIIKNQNNLYEMFNEKNIRDDKSKVRRQFLYKHIKTGFNQEDDIKILREELNNIA